MYMLNLVVHCVSQNITIITSTINGAIQYEIGLFAAGGKSRKGLTAGFGDLVAGLQRDSDCYFLECATLPSCNCAVQCVGECKQNPDFKFGRSKTNGDRQCGATTQSSLGNGGELAFLHIPGAYPHGSLPSW
jgi:hypothetical protein